MVTITRKSPFTGEMYRMVIDMTPEQFDERYEAWQSGVLIQNAFPTLTADEREFIKTGIPPVEWNEFIGEDE
jgi:hypothetical protein